MLLLAAAKKPDHLRPKPHDDAPPTPAAVAPTVEPLPDLKNALPAKSAAQLPSTADQYRHLKSDLARGKPQVDAAKARRDALKAEAERLRKRLIATAERIQDLERQKITLDAGIARLEKEDKRLSVGFEQDRVRVAKLLAIVVRLQHDTPPALAVRADDALAAARGAMLLGSSLPEVYGQAAALARRISALKATRAALVARRAEGVRNAAELRKARGELDQLLASKSAQALGADAAYAGLKARLDAVASEAETLEILLAKVAALRARPAQQSVVLVTAQSGAGDVRPNMRAPVVGTMQSGPGPGVTFQAGAGAQVVAPADCEVLFAGPYHKNGLVLILEVTTGYDLVLAGLDRIVVKPGDLVLAGEPVGVMPQMGQNAGLYFELRQNGRAMSPASELSPRKARK